jgi:hypothetical protein
VSAADETEAEEEEDAEEEEVEEGMCSLFVFLYSKNLPMTSADFIWVS